MLVSPPVNKMDPRAQRISGDRLILPPCRVANQLNTSAPAGFAMIIVADVKEARASTANPSGNMR